MEPKNFEPTDFYGKIQPLVEQDIRFFSEKMLADDRFSVSQTQVHTHNGADSTQFPLENLSNASSHSLIMRKTLTSAQITALFTTPITLVPAPLPSLTAAQARTAILVSGIAAFVSYSGTAYTGANALEFRYTDGAGAKVTADLPNTFINSAANAYAYAPGVSTALTPVANAPIVVAVPTANPATGNSTITFVVYYKIVSFQNI